MTCRDFVGFLMEYLDGEVPPAQRETFDAHLRVCPACVAYLRSYRETVRLTRLLAAPADTPVPGDVPEELVQAILSARRSG